MIALDTLGTPTQLATLARNDGNRIDQWKQLRDILRIRAGQRSREGNAVSVGDHVVLAAGFAAIGGITH